MTAEGQNESLAVTEPWMSDICPAPSSTLQPGQRLGQKDGLSFSSPLSQFLPEALLLWEHLPLQGGTAQCPCPCPKSSSRAHFWCLRLFNRIRVSKHKYFLRHFVWPAWCSRARR